MYAKEEFEFLGKYQGDVNEGGKPHGVGCFTFLNGEKYEGLLFIFNFDNFQRNLEEWQI